MVDQICTASDEKQDEIMHERENDQIISHLSTHLNSFLQRDNSTKYETYLESKEKK